MTDTSRSGDLVERCNICKRPLDNPSDPMSLDCGGDCLRCMAVIAEDPDCTKSYIEALEAEIARLRGVMREVFEEWAGSEGFIPETAPEAYLLQLTKRMADIAKHGLKLERIEHE